MFLKILQVGFRVTLLYQKFKVALNPAYRIFLNIVKMFVLLIRQRCIKTKNFRRVVFELLASKSKN